ncbi:MFS transporter [Streptosporangium sandarakinum]|uniref:MFS transporter n=1 Tax=Streptosporangium sandarakinum TaxID=1260955 RepID=UPI00379DBFF7
MTHHPPPSPASSVPLRLRPLTATFTIGVAGYLGINLSPYLLDIVSKTVGTDTVTAGWIVTGMLLATAAVGLAISPLCAGARRRGVAQTGLLVATVAFGIAALLPAPATVLIGLLVGGAGAGCAVAASGAAFAAFADPDRVAGINGLANRAIAAAVLAIVPALGLVPINVIGALAVFCLLGLLLTVWLPQTPAPDPAIEQPHKATDSFTNTEAGGNRIAAILGIAILVTFAIWAVSEDSLWATSVILAQTQAGVPDEALGIALSGATAGGMAGAFLLMVVGKRLGRALPLAVLVLLCSALKLSIGLVTNPVAFIIVFIAWNAVYTMAYGYFLATAAALDANGRWSGPLLAAYLVGSSLAPVVGAALAESLGTTGFTIAISVTSAVLAIPAAIAARYSSRSDRARHVTGAEPAPSTVPPESDRAEAQ